MYLHEQNVDTLTDSQSQSFERVDSSCVTMQFKDENSVEL